MFENRIIELGIVLPEAPLPVGAYVPAVQVDNLVFTSGQLPFSSGQLKYKGKLGDNLTEQEGYEAAKLCALNGLAVIKSMIGTLHKVEQVVKVTGYVNSAPGFTNQPKVLNGASELLAEIFGEAGKHARVAIGVNELPLDAAVEVEFIFKVR